MRYRTQMFLSYFLHFFAVLIYFFYSKSCKDGSKTCFGKYALVERCKHVKSQATTVYFKLGTLRRVSTYVQHVWGIIGHVTAEAGTQ